MTSKLREIVPLLVSPCLGIIAFQEILMETKIAMYSGCDPNTNQSLTVIVIDWSDSGADTV